MGSVAVEHMGVVRNEYTNLVVATHYLRLCVQSNIFISGFSAKQYS